MAEQAKHVVFGVTILIESTLRLSWDTSSNLRLQSEAMLLKAQERILAVFYLQKDTKKLGIRYPYTKFEGIRIFVDGNELPKNTDAVEVHPYSELKIYRDGDDIFVKVTLSKRK